MSQKSGKPNLDKSHASTSSQSSQSVPVLTEEEFKALTADVVKFILHRHHENKVAKRNDIISHVVKGKTRKFEALMDKVGKRFDKCFGIKLVNIGNQNKFFTLVNRQEEREGSLSLFGSTLEVAKDGFLSIVLAYLYMNKKPVKEERLYAFLKNLGIIENELCFDHDELGDVRKLLTKEFVDQQYLAYSDVPSHDPDDKLKAFSWGDRAHSTISKHEVFNFMGKIYECPTDRWEAMFDDVEDKFNHSDDDD